MKRRGQPLAAYAVLGVVAGCSSAPRQEGTASYGGPTDLHPGGSRLDAGHDTGNDAPPEGMLDAFPSKEAGNPSSADGTFGSFAAVDVPDVPCVAPGGTTALVAGPSADGPFFQRIGT